MDKELYKNFKEKMIDGIAVFAVWGSIENACLYNFFKDKKAILINGELFTVKHVRGGFTENGEYPDFVRVEYMDIGSIENITIAI